MNSFKLTAVGNLARNPESRQERHVVYALLPVGNDYAGLDEEGSAREVVTSCGSGLRDSGRGLWPRMPSRGSADGRSRFRQQLDRQDRVRSSTTTPSSSRDSGSAPPGARRSARSLICTVPRTAARPELEA